MASRTRWTWKTPSEDPARFIDVFRLAARQAGAVARRLQSEVRSGKKPGARSPEGAALTSVDLAAQEVILLLLHPFFQEVNLDTEEDTESVRLFPRDEPGRPTLVIDPVDGTLNYSRGSSDYAVMGAWLEDGAYRSALVHFPSLERTYWAGEGGGCLVEGKEGGQREAGIGSPPPTVLVTPRVPEERRRALREAGFEVGVSRCSAVDATAPLLGRACAALSLGRPDRRRAVGFLLIREAGGVVWTGDRWWTGEDPRRLQEFPGVTLVSENRATAERVLQALP